MFRKRRESGWLGLGAGLIGGVAGSVAIGQFMHLWDKLTGSRTEEEGSESTVKAASALAEAVDQPLPESKKPKAGAAVHFAFGGTMGALYGATAAVAPQVSSVVGVPFGASVYLGAHVAAVPALDLSKPVTRKPVKEEVGEFLGHLVYGVVVELTRRGVVAAARAI